MCVSSTRRWPGCSSLNAKRRKKNGMIEISELLRGVKHKVIVDGRVVREAVSTREKWTEVGTQTPWIARNLMVGDYSLF